jgi:hypothetical protein
MITLYNILYFLLTIERQEDASIWSNDYTDPTTDNGRLYEHCLKSGMIQTYRDNDSGAMYAETYAEVSDLGNELLDLFRMKEDDQHNMDDHDKRANARKYAILRHDARHGKITS